MPRLPVFLLHTPLPAPLARAEKFLVPLGELSYLFGTIGLVVIMNGRDCFCCSALGDALLFVLSFWGITSHVVAVYRSGPRWLMFQLQLLVSLIAVLAHFEGWVFLLSSTFAVSYFINKLIEDAANSLA